MIICSCNVLSDEDVRFAVAAKRLRSASQVYGCLGCSAKCGRCARTIRRLIEETLGAGAAFRSARQSPNLVADRASEAEAVLRAPAQLLELFSCGARYY
jgi:bacterioferritin-associated ferredoxin